MLLASRLHRQIRVSAQVRHAPVPRGLDLSADGARNRCPTDALRVERALQRSERDVMEHGLKVGILRGVEMLDVGVGSDAAAERIDGEILNF